VSSLAACLLLQADAPSIFSSSLIPFALVFVLMYFLLVRPVQKQRKEQSAMRDALKAGDHVLTSGGLYGTVKRVRDDRLSLRVADNVDVEIARTAVVSVIAPEGKD
jgi:preprotein translocase subunit YajC